MNKLIKGLAVSLILSTMATSKYFGYFDGETKTVTEWAKNIVEWKAKWGRPNNIEAIKKAGFDSKTTVKQLVELYNMKISCEI